jgi:hypothetical protein
MITTDAILGVLLSTDMFIMALSIFGPKRREVTYGWRMICK